MKKHLKMKLPWKRLRWETCRENGRERERERERDREREGERTD